MAEPYVSIAWFRVKPGRNQDFERAFHDAGMLTRPEATGGYLGARLHRATDGSNQYFVLGHWTTVESYAQWQTIAAEGAPREALNRMMDALEKNRPGVLVEPLD